MSQATFRHPVIEARLCVDPWRRPSSPYRQRWVITGRGGTGRRSGKQRAAAPFQQAEGHRVTIYRSDAVRHVAELQTVIDLHVPDATTRQCAACNDQDPCMSRRNAVYAMAIRYRRADAALERVTVAR